jgi:hypothetical protein
MEILLINGLTKKSLSPSEWTKAFLRANIMHVKHMNYL